jgi:hypothetical protein
MGRPAKSTSKTQKPQPRDIVSRSQSKKGSKAGKSSSKIVLPSKMTTYTRPPTSWPASLPFLSTVHVDGSVTLAQQEIFHPAQVPGAETYTIPTQCVFSPTPNPLVNIEAVTSQSHPAYPQCGLFAARALPPGTHILDYTGLLHSCPLPACASSDYDLAFLDRDASLAIDGAVMGNEARFINDYHGICAAPNAVFEEYFIKVKGSRGRDVWEARMGVWVSPACEKGIAKGEEICLSYGRGFWKARLGIMEQAVEGEPSVDVEDEATKSSDHVSIRDDKT